MTRDEARELQRRLLFWFGASGDRQPPDYGPHDVDGIIGPRTRLAVAAFARQENAVMRTTLPTDGTVTEELRGILDMETERAGYIATDTPSRIRAARVALLEVVPEANDAEQQIILGQVERESLFGYAFSTPDGSPSHNWGAIYANGDIGRVSVRDTFDGKPVNAGAAWNSSAVVGARQFVDLVTRAYAPAIAKAAQGDVWGYARALWRDGPGSKRPSYYTGFPPGHPNSAAPVGTLVHSALDHFHRVRAYARMVLSGATDVARALGVPLAASLLLPAPPGDVK